MAELTSAIPWGSRNSERQVYLQGIKHQINSVLKIKYINIYPIFTMTQRSCLNFTTTYNI